MTRPDDLPDFVEPPLDEVVLGVQFGPIPTYSSVDARGVWDLFKSDFPRVEEQPSIPPTFETFGGTSPQAGFHFQFGPMPTATRLWFVSDDGSHLLQFQPDRFLLNWRKHFGLNPYPRYEQISLELERHLSKLATHLSTEKSYVMDINQVEVSYINILPVDHFSDLGKWVSLWNSPAFPIEGCNFAFPEVVHNEIGQPVARLHYELMSAIGPDRRSKLYKLTITFRGRPEGPGVAEALSFMAKGRKLIVDRFTAITTEAAHKVWKRV